MFIPRYNLTPILLGNIVHIKNLITELNNQKFSNLILAKFEKDSYAISAYASTSIEGNPLPLTDVRALLKNKPNHIRDTEREILNYNTALEYLSTVLGRKKPITQDFICAIQGMVVNGLLDKKNTGKLRQEAVVVNDPKKRKIAYLPPDVKDATKLMNELTDYVQREFKTTDPLLLAGVFHKQFVIIHPFMDGNGRTTRLITKYLLAGMGLDTFQLFSFENYYNKNVTKYFSSVGVYGDYYDITDTIDFTEWLVYFTDGIIDELLRVQKLLAQSSLKKRTTLHEDVILAYLRKNGSISETEYRAMTTRARSTRILDFKRLVGKGLIIMCEKGKATYYVLSERD